MKLSEHTWAICTNKNIWSEWKLTKCKNISCPNENSQNPSLSVNVLAANSQNKVFKWTTRPRPESDKQTLILDEEMNDIETEEKRATPYDTKDKSHTNQNPGVLVSNSEAGKVAPKQEATLRLRTSVQK